MFWRYALLNSFSASCIAHSMAAYQCLQKGIYVAELVQGKKLKYLDWYPPKISVYNETWNNPIVIQCGIEPVIDFKGWDSDSHESVSK